jgi:hypothetical protein
MKNSLSDDKITAGSAHAVPVAVSGGILNSPATPATFEKDARDK